MSELKYADILIRDAVPLKADQKVKAGKSLEDIPGIKSTHLMNVDENRVKNFFYVDCYCLWGGGSETALDIPHTHSSDEVIGLVGSNPDDAYDLGSEVKIQLNGEEQVVTRTSLIYIPAGASHCPLKFNHIKRPLFYFTVSPAGSYQRIPLADSSPVPAQKEPRCSIISRTKEQFTVAADGPKGPPPKPNPNMKSTRVLHLEGDMAAGAFYVDVVFLYQGKGAAPAPRHNHKWPELIAMAGCDPDNPHNIGGLMTIVLNDEVHEITKSSLVCIPAGLDHCPWTFERIDKPTMVFTAGPSAMYSGSHKKEQDDAGSASNPDKK